MNSKYHQQKLNLKLKVSDILLHQDGFIFTYTTYMRYLANMSIHIKYTSYIIPPSALLGGGANRRAHCRNVHLGYEAGGWSVPSVPLRCVKKSRFTKIMNGMSSARKCGGFRVALYLRFSQVEDILCCNTLCRNLAKKP